MTLRKIQCVFLGQTYAQKSIQFFVNALSEINKSGQISISLDYFGGSDLQNLKITSKDNFIQCMGWEHPSSLKHKLKKYDFAFLPYFEDDNFIVGELSFPSKFILYSNANLPVLYIGNVNSSVAKLISKFKLGVTLSSNTKSHELILDSVLKLLELKVNHKFQVTSKEINASMFSKNSFIDSLRKIPILKDLDGRINSVDVKADFEISDLFFEQSKKRVGERPLRYSRTYQRIVNLFNIFVF